MSNGYLYNGYPQYGYGYQSQMQRQGQMANMQMAQPQMPQMPTMPQQPMASGVPFGEVKFVTSEEARSYTLFPNTSALLIDRQNGVAYVKYADGIGQSFMEVFSFSKMQNGAEAPKNAQEATNGFGGIDMSPYITNEQLEAKNYATREDFDILMDKIEELGKKMAQKPTASQKSQGDKQ